MVYKALNFTSLRYSLSHLNVKVSSQIGLLVFLSVSVRALSLPTMICAFGSDSVSPQNQSEVFTLAS